MKVICIANTTLSSDKIISGLTIGKTYDVITVSDGKMWIAKIIDDNNQELWYSREVVIPLDEWRHDKIKELGI
jgi:hypothetical protein